MTQPKENVVASPRIERSVVGHTAGPWDIAKDGYTVYAPAENLVIARVNVWDDEETTGNLNLVRAAPDLLEALEGLLAEHETGNFDRSVWRQMRDFSSAVDRARAALAKARGEQP